MISASLATKARKSGFELTLDGDKVQVLEGGKVLAFDADGRKALKQALLEKEAARLRALPQSDLTPLVVAPPMTDPPDTNTVVSLADVPAAVKALKGPIKGSIIKPKYKDRYKTNGDYSCGDDLAMELAAYLRVTIAGKTFCDLERLREVATTNGVWDDRYSKLNAGQQRMTIGNRLRNKWNQGERIDIGGAIFVNTYEDDDK